MKIVLGGIGIIKSSHYFTFFLSNYDISLEILTSIYFIDTTSKYTSKCVICDFFENDINDQWQWTTITLV